jgi:hypothetical protein
MTGPLPASPAAASRDDLTPRVFRALYQAYDLHTVGSTYVVVPKGTPWAAATSLGEVARQISAREHPDPPAPPDRPLDRRPPR